MPPTNVLWDRASSLLATVEARAVTDSYDLPERRFVANGDPVFDCDVLVVYVDLINPSTPPRGDSIGDPRALARSASIIASLIRCVPSLDDSGNAPPDADVQDSAQQLLMDATWLSDACVQWANDAEFDCVVGRCVHIGPEGGLGGWGQELIVQAIPWQS